MPKTTSVIRDRQLRTGRTSLPIQRQWFHNDLLTIINITVDHTHRLLIHSNIFSSRLIIGTHDNLASLNTFDTDLKFSFHRRIVYQTAAQCISLRGKCHQPINSLHQSDASLHEREPTVEQEEPKDRRPLSSV